MRIIADLHLHGKYSRATSSALDIPNLEKWARVKGVDLLGTGDFQHPLWYKHLKQSLRIDEYGVLRTKTNFPFLFSTEISLIYTQGGKGRKIHNIVLAPSFEVVDQVIDELGRKGRLDYDGRPIFGMSCVEFVEMMKEISDDIEIIPAHVWTPWFSLFGSNSGFDSIRECFADQTKHIHAIETGLSSDPAMNWRLSQLDGLSIVSFSDSHSFWPWRLGREATVFDTRLEYDEIIKAIRTGKGLSGTIEVDPSYGKYHFDGHRACNVVLEPKESIKLGNVCPRCKRKLTIGVANRVEELADREEGYKPEGAKPFKTLIPLSELISAVLGVKQLYSKKVWEIHNLLLKRFGSEFNVLLNADFNELKNIVGEKLADVIIKNRRGEIKVRPGYDGVYGTPLIGKSPEQKREVGLEEKERQVGLRKYF